MQQPREVLALGNGPDVQGAEPDAWAHGHGVRLAFIDPRKPIPNAVVESCDGRMHDECLNMNGGVPSRRRVAA